MQQETVSAILISKYKEFILQEPIEGSESVLFSGAMKEGETKWSALRRVLFEAIELTYLGAQVEVFRTYNKTNHVYIVNEVDDRKLVLHQGKALSFKRVTEDLNNSNINNDSVKILQEYKDYKKL
jgi:hypothetical protein